jgi:ribonuclease HII
MPSVIYGGIDEVGYGAWAGPYISAVAVFREKDLKFLPPGVTDSKKLTSKKMESLYESIVAASLDVGLGHAWPWEIDKMGPSQALQISYKRALDDLVVCKPTILYVDGNHKVQAWTGNQIVEPKADLKYVYVSAASIIAKVWRDRLMSQMSKKHPKYGWDKNKGYGSKDHEQAIRKYGLVISSSEDAINYVHRKRYCRKFLIR